MIKYRGYSIERYGDKWAAYNLANSMYDCHHGFASVEAVKVHIDRMLG